MVLHFQRWGAGRGLDGIWQSSISQSDFEKYVEKIRSEIAKGNVYQVNACRILATEIDKSRSLVGLFSTLLEANPAPSACYLRLPELEIASASPELFISRQGSSIKTSPIKGTRRLSETGSSFSEKDRSENIMIVDLMRNDFGRVCRSGTVKVTELLRSELHPGLEHLVSDICGELESDISWGQVLSNVLPPGSVSGTPKSTAVELIEKLEPNDRGPYCGALGWIEGEKAELSVAIRLFWRMGNKLKFGTGAGITWASEAEAEWEETELKAAKLLSIAGGFRADRWPYGDGLFETIRVEKGRAQLLDQHLKRARNSAAILGYEIPSDFEISEAIGSLSDVELGRLRLTFGQRFQVSLDPYVDSKNSAKVGVRNLEFDPAVRRIRSFRIPRI